MKSILRSGWLLAACYLLVAAPSLLAQPSLSISGTSVTEGNAGLIQAVVTVTLTPAAGGLVTVNYESSAAQPPATGGTACGGGVDFVTPTGSLQFDAGLVSKTIAVTVCGDAAEEPDEKFRVRLFGAQGATIATSQGAVTIIDDDEPGSVPSVSVDDVSFVEGNSGTVTQNATVRLSAVSNQAVTVAISALPGTATGGSNCFSGADFAFLPRTLTINAGQNSQNVPFSLCGNTDFEPTETFGLVLRNPVNATRGDTLGQVTISDDDGTPIPGRPSPPDTPINPAARAALDVDIEGALTQVAPNLAYTVTAKNTGDQAASDVLVRSTLPKDVAFVRVDDNQLGTCLQNSTDSSGALQINCTLSSLAPGASPHVIIVGRILGTTPDGTQVVFAANVDPNNTVREDNDTDNTAFHVTTVSAPPDLAITGTVSKGILEAGVRDFTFIQLRLLVRNIGVGPSAPTTIRTGWPAGFLGMEGTCADFGDGVRLTLGSTTIEGSIVCQPPPQFCSVPCPVRALAPGQSIELLHTALRLQPSQASSFTVRSTVAPATAETQLGNQSVALSFSVP